MQHTQQGFGARAMTGGFTEAVFQSQSVFRALMEALSRPGRLTPLAASCEPPAPLSPGAGAVALTLIDADTPTWLDRALSSEPAVAAWLSVQTGATIAGSSSDAQFAFVIDAERMPALQAFAQGSQDYPDRSTTLVVQLANLSRGERLRLTGPGIETEAEIRPAGLPGHFHQQWAANRAKFPRGVDIVLVAPEGVVGLPRTTAIARQGG